MLLVMPADHVIAELDAFQRAIAEGAELAAGGALVTFGIVPDRAETGYGYIRGGAILAEGRQGRALAEFVEKPDRDTAQRYLESGEYFWNSGIFMMKASVWLRVIERFNPDMASACTVAYAGCTPDADFIRLEQGAFERCPSDSIVSAPQTPFCPDSLGRDQMLGLEIPGQEGLEVFDSGRGR